jgi:hypothetical protein
MRLLNDPQFEQIVGLEASGAGLAVARTMFSKSLASGRLALVVGSYADSQPALTGFDVAAMVETIEHVKPNDLSRVEPGEFREEDHKFEWDRQKFMQWARGVAQRNGYSVSFAGIGESDLELGAPTQAATFLRSNTADLKYDAHRTTR